MDSFTGFLIASVMVGGAFGAFLLGLYLVAKHQRKHRQS